MRRSGAHELGDGAVEHRRGAVQHQADERQQRQRRRQRQRQEGEDQHRRRHFGQQRPTARRRAARRASPSPACRPRRRRTAATGARPMVGRSAPLALQQEGQEDQEAACAPRCRRHGWRTAARRPTAGPGRRRPCSPCRSSPRISADCSVARITPAPRPRSLRSPSCACRQPSDAAISANSGGQRHLADVAGEIVGAERGARAQAGKGARTPGSRRSDAACCRPGPRAAGRRSRRRASRSGRRGRSRRRSAPCRSPARVTPPSCPASQPDGICPLAMAPE